MYAVTPGIGQVFFTPEQLALISQVAGPGGRVELNAFMQLLVHTSGSNLTEQHERLRAVGLGLYPAGPVVKNLHTCTFCMGERIEGLSDAQRLDEAVTGAQVPFPVRVGFSGCASNCGEALLRDIGVVRMGEDRYDLFLGGRAGGLKPQFGLPVAAGVTAAELVPVVEALLALYRATAKGKERLWRNLGRLGLDAYRAAFEQARA